MVNILYKNIIYKAGILRNYCLNKKNIKFKSKLKSKMINKKNYVEIFILISFTVMSIEA